MCHVLCVKCHVSCVTCHVSPLTCNMGKEEEEKNYLKKTILKQKLDKLVKQVGGGSVINEAYPV